MWVWVNGLVLILGVAEIRCLPYLETARHWEQKAVATEKHVWSDLHAKRKTVDHWRSIAARKRSEAWSVVGAAALAGGAGWTGTVWGLYVLVGWVRKGFASGPGDHQS